MTKEELEKEAEEYALKQWEGNIPWSVIQKSYYDGALPREKQIQIDAEQIRALQKQNGELTDKVQELEAQIEKMKCCENCKHHYIALDDTTSCKLLDRLASSKPCDKWEIKEK